MLDSMMVTGVDGFMVDVWWGLTEMQPQEYDFEGYRDLFDMAKARDWKVQAVASFHRCGGNVGDACNTPLPPFVVATDGRRCRCTRTGCRLSPTSSLRTWARS